MEPFSFGEWVAAARGEAEMASLVGQGDGTGMGVWAEHTQAPVSSRGTTFSELCVYSLLCTGAFGRNCTFRGGATGLLPAFFCASMVVNPLPPLLPLVSSCRENSICLCGYTERNCRKSLWGI